jgi:hypothetical protein
MLWKRSLVMYDRETDSLWSHILGEAMSGELKGTRLKQLPAVMTDWNNWRKSHAEGTVVMMRRTRREFTTEFYDQLDRFVLGIAAGGVSKSWSFATLNRQPVIETTWQDQPVVVFFDRSSGTPRVYRRQLGERVLAFQIERGEAGLADKFKDSTTGSTWNPISGIATAGPLQGEQLEPLPAIVSFAKAWRAFHPRSEDK